MLTRRAVIMSSAAVLVGCNQGSGSTSVTAPPPEPPAPSLPEVIFDIVSFFVNNPLIRIISALKIIGNIHDFAQSAYRDTSTGLVSFPTNNPGIIGHVQSNYDVDDIVFVTPQQDALTLFPNNVGLDNGISVENESEVDELDNKIMADLSNCTLEAYASGVRGYKNILIYRINCLQPKYTENTSVYAQIKLVEYST